MIENINTKKQKKGSISEEDISTLLQRYPATTVLALLQEVAQFPDAKLDWNALVNKTSTGISNAREYQMLWRHLAYRDNLLEKLEDEAEPLDDDSDLEYELEPYPSVSSETSAEAAACVKVLIASGLPNDSSGAKSSMVNAPLTINIPNVRSSRVSSENLQPTCSKLGMNITVPVSVQKKILPAVPSTETLEGNGPAGANLPNRRKRKPWSEEEDLELIAAVQKCGTGNWANILRRDFKGDRSANQLAQRWSVIKKRLGNLNVEGNSVISEAQLATRNALSLALPMPDKNLTGLKTASCSAPPTASGQASVRTENQFQHGLLGSVETQNQSQTSVSSHNRPQYGPNTSVPTQSPSQQDPVASVQVPNQSQQGLMTTQSSSSGSTVKSRVTLKRVPAKPFSTTGLILDATAVAAGARIGSPKAAASLLKAAQSKNAIHIMTSGGSSIKPLIPSGTSSQYVCTGLTAEPHSSPVTSTSHPGSVKLATQRVEHTSSVSSSPLNAPIQQLNAVTSGPTIEGPLKEELEAAIEISVSESSPKEQVWENRACVSKNGQGEGVKDHREVKPNLKSELNLEAVTGLSNKKIMVKGDQVYAKANLVEECENANDSKTDCSLVIESASQPTAEEQCGDQNIIETAAKAASPLNDPHQESGGFEHSRN
ncbi:Homeodomain-like superfamily protein isoform 2 [Hibiscus syriacus]|uniref:Homeodomain-like superfamily protein isoform 2 n=1 Tax=Hibiscus syriacus TaxID=106335 RepID=A0A6A2XQG3_HIBSY|nr:Homeodomain-like superfamily protein isoform 2 [Hibiscus syriacus]